MQCPRCSSTMNQGLPHTQICPKCEGVWVDKGKLGALLEKTAEQLQNSPLAPTLVADTAEVPRADLLKCPVCSSQLTRYQYCADSGITLDRCVQHGIWFDDGELARAVDYIQLGKAML